MPKRVQTPDGNIAEFPDSMSDQEIQGVLRKKYPPTMMSAQPAAFSPAGIKSKLYDLRQWGINQLPAAGGIAGSLLGAEAGPPGMVGGAAAGGVLGEDARQILNEKLGLAPRMSGIESAARLAGQGVLQGANELGGQIGGRVIGKAMNIAGQKLLPEQVLQRYPILKDVFAIGPNKAVQHLTAAASDKGSQAADVALESIGNTIGDIEQELKRLPIKDQNVDGFLKAVNSRKDAMNLESGLAMQPIAGQQIVPLGISNNINNLLRSYMNQPGHRAEAAYIRRRATEFQRPWSFRELDELRTDLASQLSKHRGKESVAKYTAEKGDLDLAIDNAIQDGLRDTIYPAMDQAAGKPAGYFEDLKGRQSNLIRLQSVLNSRIKRLKSSQAINEAAPLMSHENVSVAIRPTGLSHPYLHGVQNMLNPPREYEAASKHVAKAFRPSVDALPYQVLLSTGIRAAEADSLPAPRQNPTDAWQQNSQ